MTIVFTNGCFDLFHAGHLKTLRFAKELVGTGGTVVVGLNSDDSIRKLKGPGRPIIPCDQRAAIVRSIRYVDVVEIFHGDTPIDLIEWWKPDFIVKGGDYAGYEEQVVGAKHAKVVIAPQHENISTSYIIGTIVGKESSSSR